MFPNWITETAAYAALSVSELLRDVRAISVLVNRAVRTQCLIAKLLQ
jgi:hypothetical protein